MRQLPNPRDEGNDQRFMTFALLSAAFFLFYMSFIRPEPQPPAQQAAAEQQADAEGEGQAPAATTPEANGEQADAPPVEIEDVPEAEPELLTIGSAELDGPSRMLITLDNRGAAITRAELSTHEFRDLDDRSGYLGELGLEAVDGGLRVSVVGPGTPAAEAGLRVGDVITDADFAKRLADAKPKQAFSFGVQRGEETTTIEATLTRRPLAVMRPESENVRLHNPKLADDVPDVPSFLISLTEAGGRGAKAPAIAAANEKLRTSAWQVAESDGMSVTFRMRLAELGLEVEKRFELVEVPEDQRDEAAFPGYHFRFNVELKNLLPQPQSVAYAIQGPNGLPIEGWWYANRIGRTETGRGAWGSVGFRDVVARYAGSNFIQIRCYDIVEEDTEPIGQGASMAYIGVDAQYFSVVMIPQKEGFKEVWFDTATAELATPKLPERGTLATYNNTTFTANRKTVQLAAADSEDAAHSDAFQVFAGPKRPELLAKYVPAGDKNYSLSNLLYYGWFGPIAQAMLGLLHFFYGFVGNYGISIILLTVLVRSCMYPLSRRQAMNMAKMQELKPEMDRIAEKYKNDMEKRSRAQQELFSKHKVSPLGGCLPMFVQLPIFIGLYRALAVDIELRQASLFGESIRFCSNLAAPDQLLDWSSVMPRWWNNGQSFGLFPGLGPYFNLLPVVTILLFLLQQKMFMPEATTEQARLQQKMMKYMMVVFGLMFFKVPSGLCLYFIASSLWGITERKLLPKPVPATDAGFSKPATTADPTPVPVINKPTGAKPDSKKKKKKKRR